MLPLMVRDEAVVSCAVRPTGCRVSSVSRATSQLGLPLVDAEARVVLHVLVVRVRSKEGALHPLRASKIKAKGKRGLSGNGDNSEVSARALRAYPERKLAP